MFGGLADQLEIPKNSIVGSFVRQEGIEVHALGLGNDLGRTSGDVLEVERNITRHGRHPVRFRSPEPFSGLGG